MAKQVEPLSSVKEGLSSTLGEELKRRREQHGIELGEIADATCIGVRFLRAIEENDFKTLPGGLFTRSFIRSYARYVGMDEGNALRLYSDQTGEGETEEYDLTHEIARVKARTSSWTNVIIALAVLAVLGLGGLAGWHYWNRIQPSMQPQSEPPTSATPATPKTDLTTSSGTPASFVEQSSSDTPAPPPLANPPSATGTIVETSSNSNQIPPTPIPSEPQISPFPISTGETSQSPSRQIPLPTQLDLSIRATGSSYVYVQADSDMPRGEILQAGDRRVFTAKEALVISAQDPSQLSITINGYQIQLPPATSTDNQIIINPRNLPQFIKR